MTQEQKKYIENNIKLLEDGEWDKFFKDAPTGIGEVLYEAGINFMSELGYVHSNAFSGSDVQIVVIPDGVTSMEDYAFANCKSLTSVVMSDSVTSIGIYAFNYCDKLARIKISDNIVSIGMGAFWGCTSLTNVVIPHNVTSIDYATFCNCISLTSIEISNSVTSIGDKAFYSCGKLEIKYDGTTVEWKHLIGNNRRVFGYTAYTCKCIDGVVKKSS